MSTQNILGDTGKNFSYRGAGQQRLQSFSIPSLPPIEQELIGVSVIPAIASMAKKPSQRAATMVFDSTATAGNSLQHVLLITAINGAENCAAMLTRQLGLPVEVARSRRSGLSALRRQEFGIVIVDEAVVEADPQGADLLWQHAGLAVPVVVNFGIAGSARLVREVRQAVSRREREQMLARNAAATEIQSELKSTIAGLLLQSQLALAEPKITPGLEAKLRSVVALASDLRDRLRPTA